MGGRRRRFQRRLALGQFLLLGLFHVGAVVHVDLRLCGILLLFLAALGAGLGIVLLTVVLPGGIGRFVLLILGALVLALVVHLVGIVAQLVTIAEVVDHAAGETGEGRLVLHHVLEIFERAATAVLDIAAPEFHDIGRLGRQVAARGKMADQVARCGGQRRVRGHPDLAIALAAGIVADLDVGIAGGAGHVA